MGGEGQEKGLIHTEHLFDYIHLHKVIPFFKFSNKKYQKYQKYTIDNFIVRKLFKNVFLSCSFLIYER